MADIVPPAVRSRMMAGIRGKNTQPEMLLRRGLHRRGFRYRLHARDLPGKPDLVFPKYRAVVFVHGCFWHGHDCPLFRLPGTRTEFWRSKIDRNRLNDGKAVSALKASGWRVGVVWECALRGQGANAPEDVCEAVAAWLSGNSKTVEFRGMDRNSLLP